MWIWAKSHLSQKFSAIPVCLCKPQPQEEHRESAVPRQLTTTLVIHGFRPLPTNTATVHFHSLSSFPSLYLITSCSVRRTSVGSYNSRTKVLGIDLCDCWKCGSTFSRFNLLFFMCLCFTESIQKAQGEAISRQGLHYFIILSSPSHVCRLCDLGHRTWCHLALSLSKSPSQKDAKGCLGPTHPNRPC